MLRLGRRVEGFEGWGRPGNCGDKGGLGVRAAGTVGLAGAAQLFLPCGQALLALPAPRASSEPPQRLRDRGEGGLCAEAGALFLPSRSGPLCLADKGRGRRLGAVSFLLGCFLREKTGPDLLSRKGHM